MHACVVHVDIWVNTIGATPVRPRARLSSPTYMAASTQTLAHAKTLAWAQEQTDPSPSMDSDTDTDADADAQSYQNCDHADGFRGIVLAPRSAHLVCCRALPWLRYDPPFPPPQQLAHSLHSPEFS